MSVFSSIAALFRRQPQQVEWSFFPELQSFVAGKSVAELFRSQPHLRTVTTFRAENVAQLGLQVFERVSDTDRRRVTGGPLARLLSRPNAHMTLPELLRRVVLDYDLYGCAYLLLAEADTDSGWRLQPIPHGWVVGVKGGDGFGPDRYVVSAPQAAGRRVEVPAENMLVFRDYDPESLTASSSPVDALRDTMAEQIAAWEYRRQMWSRGGRVGTFISRPKDAPVWNDDARNRFAESWREFQNRGARAGSSPVLEDGMELKRVGFTAREEEWAEAAKLSLQTVAAAYHVNPGMVGDPSRLSYASVREARIGLYTETLGPLLALMEARLNGFLVPVVQPGVYVEFNIQAKLAGSFEEQAAILSTSTGAPWMTVNEARARQNLPAIDGADELIVPLNVVKGGQASPQDGGEPLATAQEVVKAWRGRVERSVPRKIENGLPVDWGRWGDELKTDLVEAGVGSIEADLEVCAQLRELRGLVK